MKLINRLALITLSGMLILTVAGCGKSEVASTTTTTADAPDPQALSQELGVDLPTQEEADARAAAEITEENADEAFADLQREIESEP